MGNREKMGGFTPEEGPEELPEPEKNPKQEDQFEARIKFLKEIGKLTPEEEARLRARRKNSDAFLGRPMKFPESEKAPGTKLEATPENVKEELTKLLDQLTLAQESFHDKAKEIIDSGLYDEELPEKLKNAQLENVINLKNQIPDITKKLKEIERKCLNSGWTL